MKQNKNRKKLNITLLVVIVVMLSIGGVVGVGFYKDRQSFKDASRDIHSIFEALDYHASSKDTTQYCMYNNMKYSKGKLLCFMTVSKNVKTADFQNDKEKISSVTHTAGWTHEGSNSVALNSIGDVYLTADVYTKDPMNCFVREKQLSNEYSKIEIGCSGPARAEWFPVKKD